MSQGALGQSWNGAGIPCARSESADFDGSPHEQRRCVSPSEPSSPKENRHEQRGSDGYGDTGRHTTPTAC